MALIDTYTLKKRLRTSEGASVLGHSVVRLFNLDFLIDNTPTIDAVPVVRCKDCEYWNKRYEAMGMCMKHNAIVTFTKPDFYCAWGERKQK